MKYIFRIFRQPQGHLLLIGVSGAGKTTLSRFVAWMNGLSVYQIKVITTTLSNSRTKTILCYFPFIDYIKTKNDPQL